jgi:hypothetical protein
MIFPFHELHFHIGSPGGWRGPGTTFQVKGSQLQYWKNQQTTRPPTVTRQLSAHEWQRFLERLTEVDFWNWLVHYKPAHIILDGTIWSVQVDVSSLAHTSSGENAYPADTDPKAVSTGQYSERFIGLLNALTELVGNDPSHDPIS